MKCYIATRLENTEKYSEVRSALNKCGIEISYDWTVHGPVWRAGVERIREVSLLETSGVQDANCVIVILPGGRGTHVELGIAIGSGKQIFVLAENDPERAMIGAVPETCAFYHHPSVIWAHSVMHLMEYVTRYKNQM